MEKVLAIAAGLWLVFSAAPSLTCPDPISKHSLSYEVVCPHRGRGWADSYGRHTCVGKNNSDSGHRWGPFIPFRADNRGNAVVVAETEE